MSTTMLGIEQYKPLFRQACLEIFESNMPKFFAVYEKDLFINWLDNRTHSDYYVLQLEHSVIGCGGIFVDDRDNTAGLSWGMVHSAHHRNGYGSFLTTHRLKMIAEKYPYHTCKIETSQHTAPFYQRLGFRTVKIVDNGFAKDLHKYIMQLQ